MGQKCLNTLKYTLFVFNLLFWVSGCSILGFGIYLLIQNTYGALLPSSPSISIGNVLIIIGTVIMVVAFLGCMGAIKENRCLLMSFFILLLIILLAEVTLAVCLFVYESKLERYLGQELQEGLRQQKNETLKLWDKIQQNLKCCGVYNASDWKPSVPASCCEQNTPDCSATANYFKDGCLDQVKKWFESNFLYVGIGTICVSIIQVLGMSFALTVYCHIARTTKLFVN
ncbi:leukocyte surface antigen CD53 [Ambystoma mexicanum]|uniref:leukocyte surface antigen CD53 n=1 Tax=Ambystoma mexicanum TaxID=8296 RepID=UPI0037E7758E